MKVGMVRGDVGGATMPLDVAADSLRQRILTVRGVQVMLDRDLAELYGVETKALNQAVRRNANRFPDGFAFTLTEQEMRELVTTCDRLARLKHSGVAAKAFSEQGIAMLSAVLRSETAVLVSVRIMQAFVAMRQTLASMGSLLSRIEENERRQIVDQSRNEKRFSEIFDAMRDRQFPAQKVFFEGEVFDADVFATRHILSARRSILLIDGWVDVVTLEMLAKKARGVTVEVVTSPRGNGLADSDVARFNEQYGGLTVMTSRRFHDRFLIVDDSHLYLFGASLKDLGRKCFAFTRLDSREIAGLKARITTA